MNIAFIAVKNITRGGGIEKYTLELSSRLVKKGHKVTVFSMRHYGEVLREYKGVKIVSVFSLKRPSLQKLTASLSATWKVLLDGDYDIIHLHSVASGSFGFLSKLRGSKIVLQMHGIEWQRTRWGNSGSSLLRVLERISLLQADAYTAVSRTQCSYFNRVYNCVMHYIPTATEVKPRTKAKEIYGLGLKPSRYLLFVSRLVPEKGAHYLISAFKQIDTNMKLVIAGDVQGETDYKSKLMDLAGNDPRILFPGFVQGRLLNELFSNAHLYIQPSSIEGLSIALLEAMSYGNCCLVSDIPENLEAIGNTSYSFESGNIKDLSTKLEWLCAKPEHDNTAGASVINRIRHEYSWDKVTDEIVSLYKSLLSREVV